MLERCNVATCGRNAESSFQKDLTIDPESLMRTPRVVLKRLDLTAYGAEAKRASKQDGTPDDESFLRMPRLALKRLDLTAYGAEAKRTSQQDGTPDDESLQRTPVVLLERLDLSAYSAKQDAAPGSDGVGHYCKSCKQHLNELNTVQLPGDLVNEKELLARPEFLAVGGEQPVCRMTGFCIFDKHQHAVPLDSKMIEKCHHVFVVGRAKPVGDNSMDTEGVMCLAGPLHSWWLTGFGKGEQPLIGLSSDHADYYLGEESPSYTSLIRPLRRKMCITKVVVEAVANNPSCSYEELVSIVQGASVWGEGGFTEEELRHEARFVLSQVCSYDSARDHRDEETVLSAPCLQSLVNLRRMAIIHMNQSEDLHGYRKPKDSLATSTPVVHRVLSRAFQDQMASSSSVKTVKQDDRMATCNSCLAWKQVGVEVPEKSCGRVGNATTFQRHLSCGAYVFAKRSPHCCPRVGQVISLFERKGRKMAHLQWFCYSSETVLEDVADPYEIFMDNSCGDVALNDIYGRCPASQKLFFEEWFEEGGNPDLSVGTKKGYYFSKLYRSDTGRFEDVPTTLREDGTSRYVCYTCCHNVKREPKNECCLKDEILTDKNGNVSYYSMRWNMKRYCVGDCVFLSPGTFDFDLPPKDQPQQDARDNSKKRVRPFQIGCIDSIVAYKNAHRVFLRVRKFYRPEDTDLCKILSYESDLNLLYYSEEVASVDIKAIQGKAPVVFKESPQSTPAGMWCIGDTFVFSQMYCAEKRTLCAVPAEAREIGSKLEKRQKRGGSERRLRTLEAFAGCGGISCGLEAVGVSDTLWAVESLEVAARAFSLNFPKATVFVQDCNSFLKEVLEGQETNAKGQRFPKKGEVDFLCGGPPCQGYSLLNRHRGNWNSRLKNSLVSTLLSLCDYYRPRFFLMENVKSFISEEKGLVMQLTLQSLLRLGYQCCFGVLQAGSYGLPQDRKRFVILAAAPGELLPRFPEPKTSFPSNNFVTVKGKKFGPTTTWCTSAPLRTITLRDAISDLASLEPSDSASSFSEPMSCYQRMLKGNSRGPIRDHVPKLLTPLMQARVDHIPKVPRANWRSLPNIKLLLRNGKYTRKLVYHSFGRGISGVCPCAAGKACRRQAMLQHRTLIPWRLVHSEQRQNASHHADIEQAYSRPHWDDWKSTLVTVVSAEKKADIHPSQNRVLTPRECARLQGFPDAFALFGSTLDRYKQVGNAVPPPLAAAIGQKILESIT
uniref:Cytosine-specific methyltransferase n=2 Tax=Ixodes ricinus TaxID=34613 RepID=A0A4D6FZL5_IXORI|nr:DNA cytosine methyltransferase isoform 1 [Ixodes ricinus]